MQRSKTEQKKIQDRYLKLCSTNVIQDIVMVVGRGGRRSGPRSTWLLKFDIFILRLWQKIFSLFQGAK